MSRQPIPNPLSDPRHGPLPSILLVLTTVTGVVDAVSYLTLGHVFVANMTGNIVFLGFAAGGTTGFSLTTPLLAAAGFLVGAHLGGRIAQRFGAHRARHLTAALTVELFLIGAAVLLSLAPTPAIENQRDIGILLALGLAMGLQTATARRLAVPDLNSTVLTLTLAGLASDAALDGGSGTNAGRRLASVSCMCLGAAAGTMLIQRWSSTAALALMCILLATALVRSRAAANSAEDWTRGQ